MKKRNKLLLLTLGLAGVALVTSGCTANFATSKEQARIAYALEPGASEFLAKPEYDAVDKNTILYENPVNDYVTQIIRFEGTKEDYTYSNSSMLSDIVKSAKNSKLIVPNYNYFAKFDKKAFDRITLAASNADSTFNLNSPEITTAKIKKALHDFGIEKFYASQSGDLFGCYKAINNELRQEAKELTSVASLDFEEFYINAITSEISTFHSVITTFDKVEYGNYGADKTIKLDAVTWGDAWKKGGGLLEGLIVYPVAWLVDTFALLFAGGRAAEPALIQEAYATGVPQLLSIIVVTVIVRLFIFLVTFKSTLSQKKMSELQPELAKIQQKYPNANTNQAQKQRLAEEQMRLYKKNKVNPLSQILVLIVQFPVFIGVWGAMTGSAVLSTGSFKGLDLSLSIAKALGVGAFKTAGWWTALILIILMSVSQFFSMKIPQWLQKAKTSKVARLNRNPAQKSQNRTANIVSYVMLIMIIVMGFTLPAAMGVYWFIGAIVSIIQTIFTQVVFADKKRR